MARTPAGVSHLQRQILMLARGTLAAMVAPRPVVVRKPSERAKKEFARLPEWYKLLGKDFDPLK